MQAVSAPRCGVLYGDRYLDMGGHGIGLMCGQPDDSSNGLAMPGEPSEERTSAGNYRFGLCAASNQERFDECGRYKSEQRRRLDIDDPIDGLVPVHVHDTIDFEGLHWRKDAS